MRYYLFIALITGCMLGCQSPKASETEISIDPENSFGEAITLDNAISVEQLMSSMGEAEEVNAKIEGTVVEVCQKKGCWMKLQKADGSTLFVTFKDYGFFMPLDISGKKVVLEGKAFITVKSVDDLRHYAEDAGKTKEEIEAITEATKEVEFEATGVVLL